jgi:hypothetical protein
MKKTLLAVIVLLSIIVIPSCKKGEDDPFISVRSRDARVTAKWKLVNYEYQYTSSGGFGNTSILNGSILTVSSGGFTNSYSYSKELEINSDGTYTITEIEDGDISTSKSVWYWLNTTDDKTSISLDGEYVIDRLSTKELILRKENVSSETNNGTSYSSSSKTLLTYEKQ